MPRGKETECFVVVLCRSRLVYVFSRVIRFFGPTGRGTEEHFGMTGKVDIINSTLGKALGGAAGGYTTGPKALIDLLRQRSRPYLFSNTLPPFVPIEIYSSPSRCWFLLSSPIVASAIKAIDLIEKDPSLPARVLDNAKYFRQEMQALGFTVRLRYSFC